MSKRVFTHSPAEQKDAALSILLTNRDAWLYKAAAAVTYVRDQHMADRDLWKPLHSSFERHMLKACPQYKPLKGEYFGTLCDSGRDGHFLRSSVLCARCQFIHAENLPPKPAPALIQIAVTAEPAHDMPAVKQATQAFAAAAAAGEFTVEVSKPPIVLPQPQALKALLREVLREHLAELLPVQAISVDVNTAAAKLRAWAGGRQ